MKHFYIALFFIVSFFSTAFAQDEFITTWQTTNADESITIPTTGSGYNYTVNWGDGTIEMGFTGNATHEYAVADTYIVEITGDFPRIYFGFSGNTANASKLQSIEQWGAQQWTSMEYAFSNCINLVINATDTPDLGGVTDMLGMFNECQNISDNGGKIGDWNVSTIESMNTMFRNSSFNENINNWDVRNVKSFRGMFRSATSFNQPLNDWKLDSAENTIQMFFGATSFDQDLSNWNTGNIRDMSNMFESASQFNRDLSNWNVSKVEKFNSMFSRATAFDQSMASWDLSNASNMVSMFSNSGLSIANYDVTLIGWATDASGTANDGDDDIPSGISFNGGSSIYCFGADAHNTLTSDPYNWTITDGGLASGCATTDFFITTWQTTSANESITIPTTGSGYGYNIDWGDGTIESGLTGNATYEYATAGTYTVKIAGDFPRFYNPGLGGYFTNATKIQSIEQWGTQTWTSMEGAFDSAINLAINAIDVPDLSAVTSMQGMFFLNSSLVDNGGAIGTWDVSNVQDMGFLFRNTPFDEDISSWNTQNVTNMSNMLANCPNFDQNLGDWDISSVTNLSDMFLDSGLSTVNYDKTLIGWSADSSGITNDGDDDIPSSISFGGGSSMYCFGADAHNTLTSVPYNWSISDGGAACTVTDAFQFTWQANDTGKTISIPTTGNGFNYTIYWGDGIAENKTSGNPSHTYTTNGIYTVSIVGDFPRFSFDADFNSATRVQAIKQWGTIAWDTMELAFSQCSNLVIDATDSPNLSNVSTTFRMFLDNTNLVDNGAAMGSWDVSTIENMSRMFEGCSNFNENINNWTTTGVKNMSGMFKECSKFNQPLNNWNTGLVEQMGILFNEASKFNQDISAWNVSHVQDMISMFENASDFNQNLSDWDISNLSGGSSMVNMFTNTSLSQENYDRTLIGWATEQPGGAVTPPTRVPINITLNADATYCLGETARNTLINDFSWTITDGGVGCNLADAFITTWKIDSANEEISIPVVGTGHDFDVDWGDGAVTFNETEEAYHTYVNPGTYTIRVLGTFDQIRFSNSADKNKILSIENWGTIPWQSMELAFNGCANLKLNATDSPDLSLVTNARRMFANTTNFEDLQNTIGQWNTGNIENMNGMFTSSGFNENIGDWDVSKVKDFEGMFYVCPNFNQDLSTWDISEAIIMRSFITTNSLATNSFTMENYDKTLKGWATLEAGETRIPRDVFLSVDLTRYCDAFLERDQLVNDYGWRISDLGLGCSENEKFSMTWQTTTANEAITIPAFSGESYRYVIEWGDNTTEVVTTDVSPSHTYTNARTYTIKITSDFPRIYFNDSGDKDKLLSVEQWGIQKWTSMESAFKGCANLVINATDTPDLSETSSMISMFENGSCIDNGGNMANWNVSTINLMDNMFRNAFFEENINSWDVSGVKSINNMFKACEDFNQPLDQWNTRNLESAREVFAETKSFNQSIGTWDVTSVVDFSDIFRDASGFSTENYDKTLIGWATLESGENLSTKVTLGAGDLKYCLGETARGILTSTPYNWVITDGGTDCAATDFFVTTWQTTAADESITVPASGSYAIDWGDGSIESITSGNAIHVYETPGIHTVKISSDFNGFRSNAISRDKLLTVEQWGIKKWTSMRDAFKDCIHLKLNADDVPDLSLVTRLDGMFDGCVNLEDLKDKMNDWDVSAVERIGRTFENCTIFNEDISDWNFTVLEDCNLTFNNASAFNQNISNWDVSKVDEFSSMFSGATSFNQPLNWTFGTVDYMDSMFMNATKFNQDISGWNMESVYDTRDMFQGATAFNQDLSAWDISNIERFDDFFRGTAMSQENYDNTLIGWATLEVGETEIPTNLTLNANASYCLAETAHNTLTSAPYNWTITDGGFGCDFASAFITNWETTVTNESITIPTTGNGYNYVIDWGDGTLDIGITGDAVHSYTNAGTYTVKITGDFPRIYFNNTGDKDKIQSIAQWGDQQWTSMEAAFYGCTNIILEADDTPNLTNATNLSAMFKGATNLIDTKEQISNWDIRTIIDLSQLFMEAEKFNTSLNKWEFFAAKDVSEMFRGAKTFNQLVAGPSQAITLEGMFRDAIAFNQSVGWYTPFVTNLKDMFNGATSYDQNMSFFNISSVIDMTGMFSNAGLSTENYDQTLSGWFVELNDQDTRPNNIIFDAGSSQYCMAGDIIEKLENDHGWQITDSGASCDESDFFIMTWDLTTESSFVTPTSGAGYDYLISLPNGSIHHITSDVFQIGYPGLGIFTVRIYGDFPRFDFDAPFVKKEKLIAIEQWGNLQLTEAIGAFEGCTNLKLNATDTPDLSGVTSTVSMFKDCTNLEDLQDKINDWNMSAITNISSMFEACTTFNGDISQWDTGRIFFMDATFSSASSFNQDINNWDTKNVTFFRNTFNGATSFDQNLGNWDLSGVQFFMTDMLVSSGMSQANYDATLIGWATLDPGETKIPNDVRFSTNATYCLGKDARDILTSAPYNWSINDEGFRACDFSGAFITTWQTTNDNQSIRIPTDPNTPSYNYYVDWGDGTISTNQTGRATHKYATAGIYTVKILGQFPHPKFSFLGSQYRGRILSIEQWGTQQWTSMNSAFENCPNLILNADDVPDLSQVTSLKDMFKNNPNFEDLKDQMQYWNVSTIEDILFMFDGCTGFNEDISDWAFTNLKDSEGAFRGAATFNQDISNWNVSTVENFISMFENATSFNQPLGTWTITEAIDMDNMFKGATAFDQDLSSWDIGNVAYFEDFFVGSGLSQENYDNVLIGWATLEAGETQIPVGLELGADATYCLGEQARNTLTSAPYNWTITDGGAGCLTPVIMLLGDNPLTIELGDSYVELGAEVTYGATLTIDATAVNTNQLGNYTVTYDAINVSGATATQVTRTVNVVDTTAPVITVTGDNPQTIELGSGYTELGATTDDGSNITIDTSDFTDAIGNYTIRYNATDASGNTAAEVTRAVNVITSCPITDLPSDNFEIIASSETCVDKNNGIITINASTAQQYIVTINNENYSFTTNVAVPDLSPGTYPVCIAIDGFTNCEQCFEVVIEDAESLVGKTEVITETGSAKMSIELATGTAPYTVTINDEVIGKYTAKNFTVDVQHGDELEVVSRLACEGKLSTKVDLFDEIRIAPNPTRGNVTLSMPNTGSKTIAIVIYNSLGIQVSSGVYNIAKSQAVLPMESLAAGIYFVRIDEGESKMFKIVKE